MKIVLETDDLRDMPEEIRVGLFKFLAQQLNGETLPISDDEISTAIDEDVSSMRKLFQRPERISAEAAVALLTGLNEQGLGLLKVLTKGEVRARVPREVLMQAPEYGLDFKNAQSLNGALSGIARRFRNFMANPDGIRLFDSNRHGFYMEEGIHKAIQWAIDHLERHDNPYESVPIDLKQINGVGSLDVDCVRRYEKGGSAIVHFWEDERGPYTKDWVDVVLAAPGIGGEHSWLPHGGEHFWQEEAVGWCVE